MLALIAMEQPLSANADDIRDARAALIESLSPMTPGEVADNTFRAQSEGFREIVGVSADSETETYFRLRTRMSGPRWAGVPVMMQSGKRMGAARKEITVTMRRPEPCIMCDDELRHTNRVVFTLEPSDRIEIVFYAKKPGFEDEVEERTFSFFLYEKAEKAQYVEEYAKLLHDAFAGDQTLFVSTREIDAGWRFIDPIVDGWEAGLVPLATYPPDTSTIVAQAEAALAAGGGRGSIGVAGLGKMGAGLARNLLDSGWRVVGWNRHGEVATAMAAEGPGRADVARPRRRAAGAARHLADGAGRCAGRRAALRLGRRRRRASRSCWLPATPSSTAATASGATPRRVPRSSPSSASTTSTPARAADRQAPATARA